MRCIPAQFAAFRGACVGRTLELLCRSGKEHRVRHGWDGWVAAGCYNRSLSMRSNLLRVITCMLLLVGAARPFQSAVPSARNCPHAPSHGKPYARVARIGVARSRSSSNAPAQDASFEEESSRRWNGSASEEAEDAVASLAGTILALLAGNESAAKSLAGGAAKKRDTIRKAFGAFDVCASGTLSVDEARALFTDLARSIVVEIASGGGGGGTGGTAAREVARAHAARVLADDEHGDTIGRVATKLLLLADPDGDGRVSLNELAEMFDAVHRAGRLDAVETFPQPLRALAGSLQLLPPREGSDASVAAELTAQWNLGVPGDDHTLRRVQLGKGLSVVGLGRSADASAYFLPELGIALDAGIHAKSITPKSVLLTHGHRDHIAALPTMAQHAKILAPKPIASLVKRFLLAEAQLNYGDETQTNEQTIEALGEFDVASVSDGDKILLPKSCYSGSPTPLGVQVFQAPHKDGVPAVSYGIYRSKTRLKPQYASLPKNELGALLRNDVTITEPYNEGVLFYTGDTTIDLLRTRYEEILPKYKRVIHEVTFLGPPSSELDESSRRKGHTHYAQLHPWICAFPEVTFICVHWSLRYSRDDVLEFFEEQYGGVPKNVVLWV